MLMDYHLLFIALCIVLLVITLFLLFLSDDKMSIIAGCILSSINMILCQLNWIGFFGVQVIGYGEGEGFQVYTIPDMWSFYTLFFLLYIVNIMFIYYSWFKYTHTIWIKSQSSKNID